MTGPEMNHQIGQLRNTHADACVAAELNRQGNLSDNAESADKIGWNRMPKDEDSHGSTPSTLVLPLVSIGYL